MLRGSNGLPDPATRQMFVPGAAGPVDLQVGPEGDLYYVDMNGGTIRRIRGSFGNSAPTAVATANPTTGAVPLHRQLRRARIERSRRRHAHLRLGSRRGRPVRRLDVGDAELHLHDGRNRDRRPARQRPGRQLRQHGADRDGRARRRPRRSPRRLRARPGRSATRSPSRARRPTSAASRCRRPRSAGEINLQHCNRTSTSCHTHVLQNLTGAGGSFVAPDHEYPSYLELELTATDALRPHPHGHPPARPEDRGDHDAVAAGRRRA